MVTAAVVVAKQRGTFWGEKHRRLRARRGELRAHVAIAHKILVAAYHIPASDTDYVELGSSYLDRIDDKRTVRHLTRRIEALGHSVESWLRKSEQDDKWIFCLTAANVAAHQERK